VKNRRKTQSVVMISRRRREILSQLVVTGRKIKADTVGDDTKTKKI
jgi:hypothetical protein